MAGKTGVLAFLDAAFFCWCVSAAAIGVQGLVPTRDGDPFPSTNTAMSPDSHLHGPPHRPGPRSGRASSGDVLVVPLRTAP